MTATTSIQVRTDDTRPFLFNRTAITVFLIINGRDKKIIRKKEKLFTFFQLLPSSLWAKASLFQMLA